MQTAKHGGCKPLTEKRWGFESLPVHVKQGRLIGLGGYAMSGKDAVAECLWEAGWYRTYMSKPLHEAMMRLDPVIEWAGEPAGRGAVTPLTYARVFSLHGGGERGYEAVKQYVEARRLLQVLGTEVGREMFGQDCWLDVIARDAEEQRERGVNVAVTGIRFGNELDWVRHEGGLAVWVDRPGFGPVNGHASDNTLGPEDFDLVLHNDGTLSDLAEQVRRKLL